MSPRAPDTNTDGVTANAAERGIENLQIRRSRFSSYFIDDQSALDLRLLLRGRWQVDDVPQITAFSPLSNKTTELQADDIGFLCRLNAVSFVPVAELTAAGNTDAATISRLIEAGLVVSDRNESPDADYRALEDRFSATGWHPAAMSYHFAAKWSMSEPGVRMEKVTNPDNKLIDRYEFLVKTYGEPPRHFYSTDSENTVELPLVDNSDSLFKTLENRRTVRLFDRSHALPAKSLSAILYYVFGCLGWMKLADSLLALKKSSPSGGALHPTEAFLLIADVDAMSPGLYHYNVRNHALDEIETMSSEAARELAVVMSAGQDNLASAPVLIIMVSRYDRLFWKYRNHKKAYKVSLMDAAHLSQTFYLVCETLGLGACFTGAIRDTVIEERLHLDVVTQGVAGICACGIPAAEGEDLTLQAIPYTPRSGEI